MSEQELLERIEKLEYAVKPSTETSWIAFFNVVGAMVLFMVFAVMVACLVFGPPESAAEFGDMFGSVNAFFSGLALFGLIYTLLMQKEELQLQRAELTLTRAELQKSASAQQQTVLLLAEERKLQTASNSPHFTASEVMFYQVKESAERVQCTMNLFNHGATALDVYVALSGNSELRQCPVIETGEAQAFQFCITRADACSSDGVEGQVHYVIGTGEAYALNFCVCGLPSPELANGVSKYVQGTGFVMWDYSTIRKIETSADFEWM